MKATKGWGPIAAGAGLVAGGLIAARRRAAARDRASQADPRAEYVARFRLSHEALRRNLQRFVELIDRDDSLDTEAYGEYIAIFGKFLVVHHETEDQVIFPTLRRYGRLKSTDAAHLDRWSSEHREVNAAGEALVRAGNRVRASGRGEFPELRRMSLELAELLRPHLSSEEELFTPEHLAEIIPPQAVHEIDRQARHLFGRERAIPLFFAHSLRADEQRQVFGAAPWVFRKVILPLMDRSTFPRFVPFAISPSLEV